MKYLKKLDVNYSVKGVKTMLPLYVEVTVKDPTDVKEIKKKVYQKVKGRFEMKNGEKTIDDLTIYL